MKDSTGISERALRENWHREIEGEYLYSQLARLAKSRDLRSSLQNMADQERTHAALWGEIIRGRHANAREPRLDLRIRIILWFVTLLGPEALFRFLLSDEVSDITTYVGQAEKSGEVEIYRQVLKDETSHARAIASLREGGLQAAQEPWHRGSQAGGLLGNIVYGFNDGLTANFGLVMGVIGAKVSSPVVLLTGFAGLLADALSMPARGFLAARSEQEVWMAPLGLGTRRTRAHARRGATGAHQLLMRIPG